MKRRPPHIRARDNGGFTLLELLVSTALFLMLAVLLMGIFGDVSKAWLSGNAKMSVLQNGRAIMDFLSRDLRGIAPPRITMRVPGSAFFNQGGQFGLNPIPISYLQFVQGAGTPVEGLTPYLPVGQTEVPGSGNFFAQIHGEPTPQGNLWILGYYLAKDADGVQRLYRVLVAPDAQDDAYRIFSNVDGVAGGNPTANSWIYDAKLFQRWDAVKKYGASPVAEHVAAFWVTCLDAAGEPIPWLSAASTLHGDPASAPLKFDSAAHFTMPEKGAALAAKLAGQPTFTYLDSGTNSATGNVNTLSSHKLPAAIQITLVGTDPANAQRGIAVPPPPLLTQPGEAAAKAADYQIELYKAGQRQAAVFTTTVELGERN